MENLTGRRTRGAVLVLLILSVSLSGLVGKAQGGMVRVIIGFRQESDPKLVESYGGIVMTIWKIIPALYAEVPESILPLLRRFEEIVYVEFDAEVSALAHVVSPQVTPWGISRIGSPAAWKNTNGTAVKVAVIDTGVEKDHEDLIGRVAWGIGVVGSVNSTAEADWRDVNGHGTYETGIIAAVDNTYGVIGASPRVDIYAIKALGDNAKGTVSDLIDGIEWAWKGPDGIPPDRPGDTGDRAHVINMSLSVGADSQALHDAVDKAYSFGMVLVASAGNTGDGNPNTNNVQFPAKYSTVIAVGAVDDQDKIWSRSSDGPEVELAAPGVSVPSTTAGNTYSSGTGTSPSASHVSGAVALMLALNPKLTPNQTRFLLKTTADQPAVGGTVWPNVFYGHGILRADKAARYAVWLKGNHILGPPWSVSYNSPSAEPALDELRRANSNVASFNALVYQNTVTSSTVNVDTSQDGALQSIISKARSQNLKTAITLFVWLNDGSWRGGINPADRATWFQSYRSAVNHYAQIANTSKVDLYIIGSELENLKVFSSDWETIISDVRTRYNGMISYNTNWWYDSTTYDAVKSATWMGKLDYVGVSAFFELTTINNPTRDDLRQAWFGTGPYAARPGRNIVSDLKGLSDTFRRPILFTEIGYRSVNGANKQPWNWNPIPASDNLFDEAEQNDLYDTLFQVLGSESWFLGTLWWSWTTNPDGGLGDKGYSPRGKTGISTLTAFVSRFKVDDLAVVNVDIPRRVGFKQINSNPLKIIVTVQNQGTDTETATVSVRLVGGPTLASQTASLGSWASLNMTFLLNVKDLTNCEYVVVADSQFLKLESDKGDNKLVDGTVEVRIPGDVNGDQRVDDSDSALLSTAFGTRCGDPGYLATADFDNDCDVDIEDASILSFYYGTSRTC